MPKSATKQAVVLTEEQQIQKLIENTKMNLFLSHYTLVEPPKDPGAVFHPNESVEVGNLLDCKIIKELSEEDLPGYYLISYTSKNNNYGRPIVTEGLKGIWAWHDIEKALPSIKEPARISPSQSMYLRLRQQTDSIAVLYGNIFEGSLIDKSPLQRDYVWEQKDKETLIESILLGRPIGALIIAKGKTLQKDLILDGKQRMNAICEFRADKFPVKGLRYSELHGMDKHTFNEYRISINMLDLQEFTTREIYELFLTFNTTGVPQSEEHIIGLKKALEKEPEGVCATRLV